VRWATSQLYDIDAISKMVDPYIRGQCSEKALSRFADVISRCIQVLCLIFYLRSSLHQDGLCCLPETFLQHEPEFRPPMSEVVQDLIRMVSDATKASM
jgi:hypothetical protein